jgi:hypothetical protein
MIQVADFGMARHPPDPITDAFRDYGKFCGAEPYKAPVSDPFIAFAQITDNPAGTNVR